MAGLPQSVRARTVLVVVAGVVAAFAALLCLDRLFWADHVRHRGGRVYDTPDGDVYFVGLHSPDFGDQDVAMAARIETLKWLHLEGADITDKALTSITHIENLKDLDLSGTSITDAGLARLSGHPQLENLKLNRCPDVTAPGVLQLHDLPALIELEIRGIDVTFAQVLELDSRFPNAWIRADEKSVLGILESDEIAEARWRGQYEGIDLTCRVPVTKEWLSRLRSPEAILGLSLASWSPDAVDALQRFAHLRSLQVTRSGCDDRAAAVIADCSDLMHLSLGESSITDTGLEHLTRLDHLNGLQISSPNIRGDTFPRLGNLRDLRWLSLVCPNVEPDRIMEVLSILEELPDFSSLHLQIPLTESGTLERIRDCENLRHLYLSDCGLTDDSLLQLGPLPHVRSLDLTGNPLTAEGIVSLAEWPALEWLYLDEAVAATVPMVELGDYFQIRVAPEDNPQAYCPEFGPNPAVIE